ncbi:MAG: HAD family hydrolase [candidate division NC10 bacterium]|nr:HAD family hydrolase [candidate division NC10 bacterium]
MPDTITETARLWLFDIDGTLVAPSDDQLNAWVATFREVFGLQTSPAAISSHLGQTFAQVVDAVVEAHEQTVFPPRLQQALDTYTRHVRNGLAARPVRLLPGARELLEFLKGQRDLVGVVTGNFPAEGEPKLHRVGLRDLLNVVVYADLAVPGRDGLVRRALDVARALGFPGGFADTVVVGDSVHDIASARRTGALAVAVCTGFTPRAALAAARPDLLVPDLPALLSLLRQPGARWAPSSSSA